MQSRDGAVLEVEDLGISFGGIQALRGVAFRIEPGKIVGVMGPNGAGKTTLFNLITGVYPPSAGVIRFGGKELQGLKPSRVCRAGIGRTFQSGRPFANMTAADNVMVGLLYGGEGERPSTAAARARAQELLAFVGLGRHGDRPVASLNLMERKTVELARALATRPKLLLLDELLAGLNPRDLDPAIKVICRIRDELGITVLWIEHIMRVLMETCEHLIVLDHGEKLAEGTPREVAADSVVADAYFGKKGAALLAVEKIDVCYGDIQVVWGCSLDVRQGEIVALFGGNGVGKTTTLRAISRLVPLKSGRVVFDGRDISTVPPHRLPELGLTHVPEGRHVFPHMTVEENLELGAYAPRVRRRRRERMDTIYDLFPPLRARRTAPAGVLSGGQQQMLAIGRGLMAEPKLIMLDEPSLGLAPSVVAMLFEIIARIKTLGVTVLLVEQNLWESMAITDRYYLIETGRVVSTGTPGAWQEDAVFRQAYLGM